MLNFFFKIVALYVSIYIAQTGKAINYELSAATWEAENAEPINTKGDAVQSQGKYQPLELNGKYFCPAETQIDKQKRDHFKVFRNYKLTLFAKKFAYDQEKYCKHEVRPVLVEKKNKNSIINCGSGNLKLYIFAFQIFISYDIHQAAHQMSNECNPTMPAHFVVIYEICYDNSIKRTFWTKHNIVPSSNCSLYDQTLDNYATDNDEISTDPLDMNDTEQCFSTINKAFDEYNKKSNIYKMAKQKLIPLKDIVPPLWQKATKHVINIAPLWDRLVPLMEAINNGIRRAAMQIKRTSLTINEEENAYFDCSFKMKHDLDIYTRTFQSKLFSFFDVTKFVLQFKDFLIPDIWCKFVYYAAKKQGVLIFIHNTPQKIPQPKDMYCRSEHLVDCNFDTWNKPMDDSVENLKYAYCCQASEKIIRQYFYLELKIEKVLDIEKIINDDVNLFETSIAVDKGDEYDGMKISL